MPDFSKIPPGKYAYLCPCCGKLALAFAGVQRPYADTPLEDMEISQRGPHPSARLTKISCQHCCYPIQVRPNGSLIDDPTNSLIVEIEPWLEAYNRQQNELLARQNRHPMDFDRAYHGVPRTPREEKDYQKLLKDAPKPVPKPAPVPGGRKSPIQFDESQPVVPEGTVDYGAIRQTLQDDAGGPKVAEL